MNTTTIEVTVKYEGLYHDNKRFVIEGDMSMAETLCESLEKIPYMLGFNKDLLRDYFEELIALEDSSSSDEG